MKHLMPFLFALSLLGCGTFRITPEMALLGSNPYSIGPLQVIILPPKEVVSACSEIVSMQNEKIRGCFNPKKQSIYAVEDTKILLLLFKHYLENGKETPVIVNKNLTALGQDPYKIGPVEVWLRDKKEVDVICSIFYGKPELRKAGCYIQGATSFLGHQKVILTSDEPYALLHELKHHFEGAWHKEW